MVKIFQNIASLIMLVLTLALSQYACMDRYVVSHSTLENSTAEQSETSMELDLCSPFCVCDCCAILDTVTIFNTPFTPRLDLIIRAVPQYCTPIFQGIYFSIWQPPQLGF